MFKVVVKLVIIWGIVIASLIFIATISDTMNSVVDQGVLQMASTSNLTNYPGIENSWRSFPVWKWFLTPGVGLVLTGIVLFKYREEQRELTA